MPESTTSALAARLPERVAAAYRSALERWDAARGTERLWRRDSGLWTGADEERWLGWLEPGAGCDRAALEAFASDVAARGVRSVVLLGMGGSSLGAELIVRAVRRPGAPELHVLDTTDPDEIRAVDAGLDLARTMFIVASKSGTTIEPISLEEYFWLRLADGLVAAREKSFVAITDPGTPLEARARERGYRLFSGVPTIGGRFSALSPFGLVPAAAVGGDLEPLLRSAREAAARSRAATRAVESPGTVLGILIATLALAGHDLLTVFPPAEIDLLGPWLEQLIAESTGKQGKGMLPIAGEDRLEDAAYGRGRALVEWAGSKPHGWEGVSVDAEVARAPLIRLPSAGPSDVGSEIFRWELATAVAGSLLGLHPFDQPDVEAAKVVARRLVAAAHEGMIEPRGKRLHASAQWSWFGGGPGLRLTKETTATPADILRAHLDSMRDGDFFALLAYLPRTAAVESALQRSRIAIARRRRAATTLGFGPRYLHSTGQYMKGGPDRGVYLFVTRHVDDDLPIPGQEIGFGALQRSQALGDIEVLLERGRSVLHVEITDEIEPGLARLGATFEQALS
jgi:transaldolase/glucose-6-phosphate isomerase